MKTLNTLFVGVLLTVFSSVAMANNQTKLNVVKQAYGEAIKCMNNDCKGDPVKKYMDNGLKNAIAHSQQYGYLVETTGIPDHACATNESYRWLLGYLQDTPSGGFKMSQFKFTALNNGRVQATFVGAKGGFSSFKVQVALTCSGNTCKISDIYSNGSSAKQTLNQCHLEQ